MKKLTVLIYMTLSSWAYAQETACVSRSQFLKGEFTAESVPCDPDVGVPMKYCNADPLDARGWMQVYIASDLRNYFPPISATENTDVAERITWADMMRLQALLDEDNSESITGLFYILNTAILAAHLSELAIKADVDADFQMLINPELKGRYFIYGLPKSVSELERVFECAARCGDTGANMEKLTRSPVFSSCTGGVVTSTY